MTLTYHDVADDDGPHSGFVGTGPDHYRLTPSVFARHLDAIASSGIAPSLVTDARDEHRRVYLTFDDGGSSAVTAIAPMLVERGWRGHFFVTTDRIGSPGFLTPGEVRELSAHGHVIGSHGHTHRMLTTLSQADVADEWRRSRALLEDLLGQPLISASVPTGAYSGTIGRLAGEAGYRHVFTSEPWLRPRRVGDSWIYGRFAIVHGKLQFMGDQTGTHRTYLATDIWACRGAEWRVVSRQLTTFSTLTRPSACSVVVTTPTGVSIRCTPGPSLP